MDDCNDTNNTHEPPTRDELIAEIGRVGGLLDCLAALVMAGDVTAARAMARAMRDGGTEGGVEERLVDERPKLTGWAVQSFAMVMAEHLDAIGAPNHCAWSVAFPAYDGKLARRLDLVAQWEGRLTTADRIAKAERERDAALRVVAAVRRERNARVAWLASLPGGSCGNPPSAALVEAEAITAEALEGAP